MTFVLEMVKQRKMTYFGHIMRKTEPCLEKCITEVTTPWSEERRPACDCTDG